MIGNAIFIALSCLVGLAVIVGAFNAKRLIAWEDRQLTRAADAVHRKIKSIERVPHNGKQAEPKQR